MQPESADLLLQRHASRNFWLNVLDGMAFVFGISMVSRYTVLPFFVSQLSSDRWLQGMIPTLTQVGWALPPLFMAPFVASLPRRKPLIMLVTIGERVPLVDDACDAFLKAGASDVANGQVFNLGGPEPISLRDLLDLMIEVAGQGSYKLVPFPDEKKAIQ